MEPEQLQPVSTIQTDGSKRKNLVSGYIFMTVGFILSFVILSQLIGTFVFVGNKGGLDAIAGEVEGMVIIFFLILGGIGSLLVILFTYVRLKNNYPKIVTWSYWVLVASVVLSLLTVFSYPIFQEIEKKNRQKIVTDLTSAYRSSLPPIDNSAIIESTNPWTGGRAITVNTYDNNAIWDEKTKTIELDVAPKTFSMIKLGGSVDQLFNIIKFDYNIIASQGSGGTFEVYVDNKLIFTWDVTDLEFGFGVRGPRTTGSLKIPGDFIPGSHYLEFRFDNYSTGRLKVIISNIVVGTSE